MYKFTPGLPFILVGVMHFIAALLTLLIIEPKIDTEKSSNIKSYLNDLMVGFKELTKNENLKKISLVLGGVGMVVVVCSQVLNDLLGFEFGFSPAYFGVIAAIMYLLSSISSHNSTKLVDYFGEWKIILFSSVLIAFTLMLSPWLGVITGIPVLL